LNDLKAEHVNEAPIAPVTADLNALKAEP